MFKKKDTVLPYALAQQENIVKKSFSEYLFPSHKIAPIGINITDTLILLILLFIGILTRIYRIQFPMEIVSNEERIGKEINNYQRGLYFQDYDSPPFVSMFYYFISKQLNYKGTMNYTISARYCTSRRSLEDCIHIQFKTISAILSGFCSPLIYLTARIMLITSSPQMPLFYIRLISVTSSVLFIFETSLIAQERFMFADGLWHHCICSSLFFIAFDNYYLLFHSLLFKCFYLSLSFLISPSQSFGIVLAAIIREFLTFNPTIIFRMNYAFARSLFIIAFIFLFQYFFYLFHIKLLPFENHEIHSNIPAFINDTLLDKNNPNWKLRNEKSSFISLFFQCIYLMFHRSNNIKSNRFESKFWRWPFGNFLKSILYVDNYNQNLNKNEALHHYYSCIPNIFIYLIVFGFVLFGVAFAYKNYEKIKKKKKFFIDFWFLLIGYDLSIMPFLFIKHTFLNNYSVALIFGFLFFSINLHNLIKLKFCVATCTLIICTSIIGFFLFSPYVYGLGKKICFYFFEYN